MAVPPTSHRVIQWVPRILCIAFAAFLVLFSLDVFGGPASPVQKLVAFLIHTIPTFGVLLLLWLTWRREWIGVIVFPLLALLHLVSTWGRLHWLGYSIIEVPLLVLAFLYWMSWRARKSGEAPTGGPTVEKNATS